MKNLKKLSSVLMLILFMYIFIDVEVEATSVVDSDIDVSVSEQTQLINDFFGSIGQDNWDTWVSYYADSVQEDYQKFVNNVENIENNAGILTIQKAQVLDIKRVSNTYVPKTYPELQSFFENENTYECYVVKINTQVEKDNGYFSDGTSYHLIIIVKDNGSWKVGTICGCPIELLDADASVYAARSIGYGLITYISKPSYIDVMDENGTVHKNESFTEFVVNATCNEIGNEGYSDDALKANVMAIKMCGWWAIAGDYREAYGCDIKNGDVEYRSTLRTTTANTKTVRAAVTAMDGYCMVSSSGTGGKLFFASFIAGSSNADGAGSGRLRQNGSEYLASKKNYTWGQILHYYYDNSSYNNPSVGIVQFKYAS